MIATNMKRFSFPVCCLVTVSTEVELPGGGKSLIDEYVVVK